MKDQLLLTKFQEYCNKYNIPLEFLFDILEDQKVTPMIRGKALEYNVFLKLEEVLPKQTWSVQKLNLNPQINTSDEDISVTHRKTGIILKVESKSAVRGSFSDGKKSRLLTNVPHFKVKSHRSRSNIKLSGTSNDRYSVDSFDVIVTTPENSIYQGNTIGEYLEIIHKPKIKDFLFQFYNDNTVKGLIEKCRQHWLFCIPSDIADENGFIPRTPYVRLENDLNWQPLQLLEKRLIEIVKSKRSQNQSDRRN